MTRLLVRRKATKDNSEGDQKAIAKCHRKSQLDRQNCRGYVGENWRENKILDIVLSSRRQLEKAKYWPCQHTDFRIPLMRIQRMKCIRKDICPSRGNQYLCKSWKMKAHNDSESALELLYFKWWALWRRQGLYLSGSF